jgi:hypothetical protein
MTKVGRSWHICAALIATGFLAAESARAAVVDSGAYLDARANTWLQRGNCALSCHTTFPFLAARQTDPVPAAPSVARKVRELVEARVTGWATGKPWYASIPEKARANEAVMNAAALALNDANAAVPALSPTTRRAFEIMWALQRPSDGAWEWMDNFGLAPWETDDSPYWGALQAILAVGRAPGGYLAECTRSTETGPKLALLKRYLKAGFHKGTASAYHKAFLLQAAALVPGLLTASETSEVVADLVQLQASDGSWSLAEAGGWSWTQAAPSAYATAVMTISLRAIASSPSAKSAAERGRRWLRGHQRADGAWADKSVNDPDADFNNALMTDAATAYAVMALR